jgi:hypothetical protein
MKSKILWAFTCLLFFISCQKKEHAPLSKSDKTPSKLTNIKVDNTFGGAKISYALPDDPDLLYVLATFSTREGEERMVKSSIFKNFVVLDGFGDTNEYTVNLYTVNRSENKSEPITTTIKPLTPPIQTVFKTLQVTPDFGGVNIQFVNEREDEFVLYTLYKNTEGEWVPYDRLYTKAQTRSYSVRGFPAEPIEFAFYLSDAWKNKSDTLFQAITPLYEVLLDKSLWKLVPLDNDTYEGAYGLTMDKIWDGSLANVDYFIGNLPSNIPNWFTVDLGVEATFSRLKVWQYPYGYEYQLGNPRTFEIWGSNNPSQDGSWDNWTLLLQCESIKPSGSPVGVATTEDKAYAQAGEDFNFPISDKSYRYIRFKTLRTWTGATNLLLLEMSLYGQPH